MQDRDYVDISFTVKASELAGRRLLRDLKTGQMFYDPPEPVVPEGYFDGPPNPPLPPKVDADVLTAPTPVNPAPKSRAKKRLIHG
jgi:hypothetical protein